jgi:4-oxalocrotonate tautomerase
MPHVIVKLWKGKSEQQKAQVAEAITKSICDILKYTDESVSVSIEDVQPAEWDSKVYTPDIMNGPGKLYKKPGYEPFA